MRIILTLLICLLTTNAHAQDLVLKDVVVKDAGLRTSYTDWTQDASVVGCWRFNDDLSDTALDTSGNDNHGDVRNGAIYTTGKEGNAWIFDGGDDTIDCGSDSSLEVGTNYTMMCWMFNPSGNAPKNGHIIGRRDNVDEDLYMLIISGGNTLESRMRTVDGATTMTDALPDNQWNHLALVKTGTTFEVFINGISVGSDTRSGALGTGNNFYIGSEGANDFNDKIDEVIIFDRALSATEVMTLYKWGIK